MTIEDVIERETGMKVTESTPIQDLPVDSLEFLDLILTIERETGKNLPDGRMPYLMTVRDIMRELA